jgi:hypothetical protein
MTTVQITLPDQLAQDAEDDPSYMSPEDVAEEIRAMRAERRARERSVGPSPVH